MALSQFETAVIYISLVIINIILAYVSRRSNKYIWSFIGILFMSIVLGFRDKSVGIDTIQYAELYEQDYYTWFSDVGFVFITSICRMIMNVHWYIFTLTFLIYFFMSFGLWKLRKYIPYEMAILFCILGFFFPSLNTIRQMLSISLIIYGIHFLFDKKSLRYLIVCVCATLVHFSGLISLLGLVFFVFYDWKNKKSKYKVFYLMLYLIVFAIALFYLFRYLSGIISSKIEMYLDSSSVSFGLFGIFTIVVVIPVCFVYRRNVKNNDNKGVYVLIIVFTIISIFGSLIGYYFTFTNRIFAFFTIFEYLLFASFFDKRINNYNNIEVLYGKLVTLFLLIYPFVSVLLFDGYNAMNYLWGGF